MIYNIDLQNNLFTVSKVGDNEFSLSALRSGNNPFFYKVDVFNEKNELILKYKYRLFKITNIIEILSQNFECQINISNKDFKLYISDEVLTIKNVYFSFEYPFKHSYNVYLNNKLYAKVKSKWFSDSSYRVFFISKDKYNYYVLVFLIMVLTHSDSGV